MSAASRSLAYLLPRIQQIIADAAARWFPGRRNPEVDPGDPYSPWQQVPNHAPYMPEWTDPEWRPEVEYSADGKIKRTHFVGTGTVLRPAILPGDAAQNPTEYARRFGIYPNNKPDDPDPDIGRSLVTPTTIGPGQAAAAGPWGEAEGWQSYVFGGPTTREMIDSGVYDPAYRFTGPALEGQLHPFLRRDRWLRPVQMAWDPDYIGDTRWSFGDSEGLYSPADNDTVFRAMLPALRLVGRVLDSNHPYWNANLSLYHLRPVPDEVDGRTEEARQNSGGVPLVSLWLDENKPGMYKEAEELKRLGFKSRDTTMAILNQYLRFAIGTSDDTSDASAFTHWSGLNDEHQDQRIIIVVNPKELWQLLTPAFPEARIATEFQLANTILHELSHACRFAHIFLLTDTARTLLGLPDDKGKLGITDPVAYQLPLLGRAIYGTNPLKDYFFQDGPQSEEGKSFEKEIWGSTIDLGLNHGFYTDRLTILRPYLQSRSWPTSHGAPHLQHKDVDRSFYTPYAEGGYTGFLLDPPAPVYDEIRPIPIESYARFLRETWWESDFTRFGHQALKIMPTRNALTTLNIQHNELIFHALAQRLGKDDVDYIVDKAMPLLVDLEQWLLWTWLWMETEDLILSQATYHRFVFESRTWRRTFDTIVNLIDKSMADIDDLRTKIGRWLPANRQGWITPDYQQRITSDLQPAIQTLITKDLMEVDRLVRNSIQYAQFLIAMYSVIPAEHERRRLHQDHMRPLRVHLRTVQRRIDTLVDRLQLTISAIPGVPETNVLGQTIGVLRTHAVQARQNTIDNAASLEHTVSLLADDLIAPGFDYTSHPNTLPHVPDAMKRTSMRNVLRKAALRPLRYLDATKRSRATIAVQKWLAILTRVRGEQVDIVESVDYPVAMDVDEPEGQGQGQGAGAGAGSSPSSSPSSGGLPGFIPGQFPR